jgi:hypothetical protein
VRPPPCRGGAGTGSRNERRSAVPDPGSFPRKLNDLTDEELDRYILARLAMAGVDLSVLPEEDGDAPADRERVLRSARALLRATIPEISRYELDEQEVLPSLYPALRPPGSSGGSGLGGGGLR